LKARFLKEGEHFSKVELLALLVGQTAQKTYNAYGMVGLERTFLGAEQFPADTVLKYGKLVQDLNPVSLSLNFGLWKAYEKANNPEFATVYKKRFDLICETILASGNGSPARPYLVISPVDGSVLISKYWQETLTQMGSGENEAGYFLDTDINDTYKTNLCITIDVTKRIIKLFQNGTEVGVINYVDSLYEYQYQPNFYLGCANPGVTKEEDKSYFKGEISLIPL
jgi:hypothetical protein